MQEFVGPLLERFPLLERMGVPQGEREDAVEILPPFLGLFMAAMDTSAATPLCFVLPLRNDVARLAAVLYSLQRFEATGVDLIRQYGEINFKSGELVRIHPSRHVYRFLGFDPRFPDRICLRPPNGSQKDRWSIEAAKFVPRLERTTLTRPIGRMNIPIHDPDPSPLDQLLGTSTFGNQGLFRNEVVLLDSATEFERFAEYTTLLPIAGGTESAPLKKMIPFGELAEPSASCDGHLVKWDQRNPSGEPLVAVTSSAERLAAYCIDAPKRSKLVVVNGLGRVRDLQAYDDMQRTQRLVLFADENDEDLIQVLGDRGCCFWELSLAEIEAGLTARPQFDGTTGRLRIWARNKERLALDAEACDNPALEEVYLRLEGLRPLVDDDHGPAMRLVARMWGFLNQAAARVKPMCDEGRTRGLSQLQRFCRDLQANRAWLAPEVERALAESASHMKALLSGTADLGSAKAAALEGAIAHDLDADTTSVVLVRSQHQRLEIEEFLHSDVETRFLERAPALQLSQVWNWTASRQFCSP